MRSIVRKRGGDGGMVAVAKGGEGFKLRWCAGRSPAYGLAHTVHHIIPEPCTVPLRLKLEVCGHDLRSPCRRTSAVILRPYTVYRIRYGIHPYPNGVG